jgi:hypothetical protein
MVPWSVHARNVWLIVRRILLTELRVQKTSNLKVRLSQLTTKKVPALALIVVAMVGMVAGVLAATIVVGQTKYTGEAGTYHNNSATVTATDNGLAVVANPVTSNVTSAVTWGATGTNKQVYNTLVAGDWMDYIAFTTTLTDTSTHTVTVTIRSGTGALGSTTLVSLSSGLWTAPTTTTSTATITMYLDLGVQTINSPLTVYVNVS